MLNLLQEPHGLDRKLLEGGTCKSRARFVRNRSKANVSFQGFPF